MPTEIKQVRDEATDRTILRVNGEMFRDDAFLVVRIAEQLGEETSKSIVIDLADLDLLDSEAAHILRRSSEEHGFLIEGTDVLLQTAIDEAERNR